MVFCPHFKLIPYESMMRAVINSLLDPVHTSTFSFENAYILMRLGLPSTLIRSNTLSVFTENASI